MRVNDLTLFGLIGVALPLLMLTTITLPPPVESARILAVYTFPGKSHFMMHNELVRLLIQRGHSVTYLTPFTLAKENLGANYTEVLVPAYNFWSDITDAFKLNNLFEMTKLTTLDFFRMMNLVGIKSTEFILQQPEMQKIINAKVDAKHGYDLLLTEQFYNEAFLALAYKYQIPVITTSTFGYANYLSQVVGIISPWSYVPHAYYPLTDRMNLWERMQNIFYSLYDDLYRAFIYLPRHDALVRKYFGHLPIHIPSVPKMAGNISAILLNSYMPLTTARPTSFNMIPVGGMHIYPPKALPKRMQQFLDGAKAGAIYFSLGTNVRSSDMPPEMLRIFLKVFASIPQRVLWKYEDENISDLPSNVMVQKWMPQNDILAHPNVKIFITHGGLFGTQESVHYGVPLLGMPIFCDQLLNMEKAMKGGYAISMHFQSITEQLLSNSIRELIEDPKYMDNVKRISRIFRDRPADVKETAIYWMEYVIRHRGATHMHAAGTDLTWYEFYLLDVAAIVVAAVFLPLYIAYVLWRKYKRENLKLKQS